MSIERSQNEINIKRSGATTQTTTSNVEAKKLAFIPFPSSVTDKEKSYFVSDEFLKLPQAEQLAKLKEVFPGVEDSQLSEFLASIKSTVIVEEEPEVATGTQDDIQKENSETETSKNIGVEDFSFETLIKDIKKTPKNQRTPIQDLALDFLEAMQSKKEDAIKKFLEKNANKIDGLLSQFKETNSANMSARQKLDNKFDFILKQLLPNGANFSQEVLDKIRTELYDKIGSMMDPTYSNKSNAQKELAIDTVAIMFDVVDSSKKSFSDIISMTPEQRAKFQQEAFNEYLATTVFPNFLKDSKIDVNSEEWKSLPSDQQFDKIADIFLKSINSKYDANSPEAKELKQLFFATIAMKFAPNEYKVLQNCKDPEKAKAIEDSIKRNVVLYVSAMQITCVNDGGVDEKNIRAFLNDVRARNKAIRGYAATFPEDPLKPMDYLRMDTQDKLGRPNVSKDDMIKYLESKGELNDEDKNLLKQLKIWKEIDQDGSDCPQSDTGTIDFELKTKYKDPKTGEIDYDSFIEDQKKAHGGKLSSRDKFVMIRQCADIDTAMELGRRLGLSEDQVKSHFDKEFAIRGFAEDKVEGNVKGMATHMSVFDAQEDVATVRRATRVVAQDSRFTDNDLVAIIEPVKNQECVTAVVDVLSETLPEERFENVSSKYYNSENVSDENKSRWAYRSVEVAKDDTTRLKRAKVALEVENPAIAESVAAASKFVEDSSIKNQYIQEVKEAAQHYSSSETQAILTALETGKTTLTSASNIGGSTTTRKQDTSFVTTTNQNITKSTPVATSQSVQEVYSAQTTSQVSNQTILQNNDGVSTIKKSREAETISTQALSYSNQDTIIAEPVMLEISSSQLQREVKKLNDLLQEIEAFEEKQGKSIKEYEEKFSSRSLTNTINADSSRIIETSSTSDASIDSVSSVSEVENSEQAKKYKQSLKEYFTYLVNIGGLNAVYEVLDDSKKSRFVTRLAQSGNLVAIRQFAALHQGDRQLIMILFQYTNDLSLLQYLDSACILDLYYKGKILDISKINNPEVLAKIVESKLQTSSDYSSIIPVLAKLKPQDRDYMMKNYPDFARSVPNSDAWVEAQYDNMRTATTPVVTRPTITTNTEKYENLYGSSLGGISPTIPNSPFAKFKKQGRRNFA